MTTATAAVLEAAGIAAASGVIPDTAAIIESADVVIASGSVAPPVTITATQSYTLVIRDTFHDKVAGDPFFQNYTVRKNKMLVVRPEYLPYLGVYIIDDTMLPDGDFNIGDIRFKHTLRIGFSVMIANNDQVVLEQTLDAAFWRIMNRLWTDGQLTNLIASSMPDNVRFEGITRGLRRHVFGATALNNETPVGEMQYDVSVFSRSEWWPDITETLDMITSQTRFKSGHDGLTTSVKQVELVVDYTQPGTPPFPPSMPDPIPTKTNGASNGIDQPDPRQDPAPAAERPQGE